MQICDDFLGHTRLSTEVRIQSCGFFSVRKHFKWLMPLGCLSGEGKDNFTVDLLNDISGMCTAKKFLLCLVLIRDFNLDFF